MVRDLGCDWTAGAVDVAVAERIRTGFPIGDEFVEQMASCHGGRPRIGKFSIGSGIFRIGRFLTLIDCRSPARPEHWSGRVDDFPIEIEYLVDGEHPTMWALFSELLPFASMRDGLSFGLTGNEVDLLCLDFRHGPHDPPVVLWRSNDALDSFFAWEKLSPEERFDSGGDRCVNVGWDDFLVPVADSFGEFVDSLREAS